MRFVMILPGFVLAGAVALGQPPATPAPLDEVLLGWEKSMGSVKAMEVDLSRTRLDKTFGSTEIYEGKAKFVRSTLPGQPSRASLDLKMKARPEIFERYIFTG